MKSNTPPKYKDHISPIIPIIKAKRKTGCGKQEALLWFFCIFFFFLLPSACLCSSFNRLFFPVSPSVFFFFPTPCFLFFFSSLPPSLSRPFLFFMFPLPLFFSLVLFFSPAFINQRWHCASNGWLDNGLHRDGSRDTSSITIAAIMSHSQLHETIPEEGNE